MAGKPNLIAVKGNDALVIDVETGRPSPAHSVQVMIYRYAVPKAHIAYREMNLRGHVVYPEVNVDVLDSAVDRNSSTTSPRSSRDWRQ